VRVDKLGNIYILEINPTPALFYPPEQLECCDYIIKKCFGGGHEAFLQHLVKLAFKRVNKKEKSVGGYEVSQELQAQIEVPLKK
jgi:hypothetical protein